MAQSEARRRMSLLIEAYGTDGVLVVQKTAPAAPLTWPPCECGNPVCPDYRGPDGGQPPGERPAGGRAACGGDGTEPGAR
ncbi:hypothetical protein AB0O07_32430 [Streptomyces sp. NPDC093085]|uniref:hypothetical protein n=1 Tax=Streptomyces sp. NPDC093085 TaxID=3155068 RepID=UPI0034296EBE